MAAILSIVETCRRLRPSLREYLAAVLPGLASASVRRAVALTPAAWVTSPRSPAFAVNRVVGRTRSVQLHDLGALGLPRMNGLPDSAPTQSHHLLFL